MSDSFNGYHVWLGIPLNEQPPNHYRLLGIALFETDLDVIDHAADRQMAHVRTFQSGRNAALSQRILNELATVRVCLLNSDRKRDYDDRLRAEISARSTAVPVGKAVPVAQPVAVAVPHVEPASKPVDDDEFEMESPDLAPLASRLAADDDPLADDAGLSAPAIKLRAPKRLVDRDLPLQRAMLYILMGVVILVVVMVLFGMVRRMVGRSDWKQWFTVPPTPESAPLEGGAKPATPPEAPAPPEPGRAPGS